MPRTQCFAEKRGRVWRGRYPDAEGRMRTVKGSFPTKNAALKAARAARDTVEKGTWRDPKKADITLADWVAEIWPTWDIELTTRANYSYPIRRFILPAFGDRPLKSIKREEIDKWERALIEERGYSVEYIRGARRRLHTIFADAVTAGHITVNPASRQRGRGRKASQDRTLATAERVWINEDIALQLAERCALLGGEAEFARILLMAFTGLRWGEVTGLQASYVRAPDHRRGHHYIRVEWQLIELSGKFYLAPPKDGSRRDVDIPEWLYELLARLKSTARRCRCQQRPDGKSACGSDEAFMFLGREGGHARRSNYASRIFRPACDGSYPADKPRRGYERPPWRVHCYLEPWPGIPVPMYGIRRAKVEEMADCCWGPLARGLTPHGLRHGHQTAMRRDRVPRVLRRDRLGHGRSSDIADHYTHIDAEMIEDLLARQTERWRAAINARARIDQKRGAEPRSAVPTLDAWLAPFRSAAEGTAGAAPGKSAPKCAPNGPETSLQDRPASL